MLASEHPFVWLFSCYLSIYLSISNSSYPDSFPWANMPKEWRNYVRLSFPHCSSMFILTLLTTSKCKTFQNLRYVYTIHTRLYKRLTIFFFVKQGLARSLLSPKVSCSKSPRCYQFLYGAVLHTKLCFGFKCAPRLWTVGLTPKRLVGINWMRYQNKTKCLHNNIHTIN